MEKRILYAVLLSAILGMAIGFGLSYVTSDGQVQALEGEAQTQSNGFKKSKVEDWHLVYSLVGTIAEWQANKTVTEVFEIKGKMAALKLSLDGWVDGNIKVGLHFSNGTLCSTTSMAISSLDVSSLVPIQATGYYYLNITAYHYWKWNIDVWNYY